MQPPEGSEPEGQGVGKPWVPRPGVTFLAFGALVRSLLDQTKGHEGSGLVGVDVQGKWNHGAHDTLSIIVRPDVAEEWGRFLLEGAAAARLDQERYRKYLCRRAGCGRPFAEHTAFHGPVPDPAPPEGEFDFEAHGLYCPP